MRRKFAGRGRLKDHKKRQAREEHEAMFRSHTSYKS